VLTGFQQLLRSNVLISSGIDWNDVSCFGINFYFYTTEKYKD